MTDHTIVGKVGRLTDRIWPNRLGAVLIPVRGGTEEFYARAAPGVAIAAGETVKVTAYMPPRSVDVELVDSEPGAPPFRIYPRG